MNRVFWTELWYFLLYLMAGFLSLALLTTVVTAVQPGLAENVWYYHMIQWLQTVIVMVLPAMIWCKYRLKDSFVSGLCLSGKVHWKFYLIVLVLSVIALPLLDILAEACRNLPLPEVLKNMAEEESATQELLLKKMLSVGGIGGWVELVLLMSVATAIGEEMTFRGALLTLFRRYSRWNKHVIAIVVGLIFSAIHMEIYGLIPRWILGTAFVYLVYYSGSIWPSVLAHAINNLFALLQYKYVIG